MSGRLALGVVLLSGVYVLVLGSLNPWDVAAGVLVAVVVLVGFRRFLLGMTGREGAEPRRGLAGRILRFPAFAAAVGREVVVGTWQVLLIVAGVRSGEYAGIVAVPIGERTELGVAVSSLTATLSPGELLLDVDWERGVMLLHVLDAREPADVVERHQRIYRDAQRPVFP